MKQKSLIDTKSLSKPIVKLIDVISRAIGTIYEPIKIERNARANAVAKIINAKADIEVNEIEARALKRFVETETKKQKNIESIVQKSILFLPQEVSSKEKPDEDWITDFFELSQNCSNEQIQTVWAKLLANEVDKPGSFSRKTLHVLKILSSEDANRFTDFCGHLLKIEDSISYTHSLIVLTDKDWYDTDKGWWITREDLLILFNLDLIFDHDVGLAKDEKFLLVDRKGKNYETVPSNNLTILLWSLTKVGIELFSVINPPINNTYIKSSIKYLRSCGVKIKPVK